MKLLILEHCQISQLKNLHIKFVEIVDYDPANIKYDKNKYVGVFEKKLNISKLNKRFRAMIIN